MKHIVVTNVPPELGDSADVWLPPGRVIGCAAGHSNGWVRPTLQVWQEVESEEPTHRSPPPERWVVWVLRAGSPAPVRPPGTEWDWDGLTEFRGQPAAVWLLRAAQ